MSYNINKTDGSTLVEIADGELNSKATGLTLIGKNVSGFGEVLNENLVKLLENFANVQSPDTNNDANALAGQLWFDTSINSLKIYTGTEWKTVGSAALSDSQPGTLRSGDLWYDTLAKQLFFFAGDAGAILVAPAYTDSQRKTGLEVKTVKTIAGNDISILQLYIAGILVGIFSTSAFSPQSGQQALDGYTNLTIESGFNLAGFANSPDFKFRATATNADALDGTAASLFVRKDENSIISAVLSVINGINIGPTNSPLTLSSSNGNANIGNTAVGLPLTFTVRSAGAIQTAISINPTLETVSIYPGSNTSKLAVGGSVIVEGDLTVRGASTTITTTNLIVKDKLIELNKPDGETVDDVVADGGGIVLKGTTDHSITWNVDSSAWVLSEHLNINHPNGILYINGVEVLNGTRLSEAITSAPGLSSFGTQTELNIGADNDNQVLRITGNTISTLTTDTNITLSPNGDGNIELIGSPRITGLAAPIASTDAVRKSYVDNLNALKPMGLSMDITGLIDADIIDILNNILPIDINGYLEGTTVKIATSRQVIGTTSYAPVINKTTVEVTANDTVNYSVLRDVNIAPATIAAPTVSVIRDYLWYQVQDVSGTLEWLNVTP
jgi:uncharacterized Zn ribbon protein